MPLDVSAHASCIQGVWPRGPGNLFHKKNRYYLLAHLERKKDV